MEVSWLVSACPFPLERMLYPYMQPQLLQKAPQTPLRRLRSQYDSSIGDHRLNGSKLEDGEDGGCAGGKDVPITSCKFL